jgi:hypothetical protein
VSGTLVSSRPELDFGDILQSEQKTETLNLTNTGPVPVEIVRIESGCGCVVARRREPDR